MQDLKEVTQETHYENFRAAQLSGESPLSQDMVDSPANGKRCVQYTKTFTLLLHFINNNY